MVSALNVSVILFAFSRIAEGPFLNMRGDSGQEYFVHGYQGSIRVSIRRYFGEVIFAADEVIE
jgi:hypothetical protein